MSFWWNKPKKVPDAKPQRLQVMNKEDDKVMYTKRKFYPNLSYEGILAQVAFDLMERVEALEKEKEK